MSIEQLKARYFWLNANDATTDTEPEPQTMDSSLVEPLIDMKNYMDKLIPKIEQLGTGDFLYIAGWLFSWVTGTFKPEGLLTPSTPSVEDQAVFDVDPESGEKRFIDLLISRAKAGVDVRVLGWVSYSTMGSTPYHLPIIAPLFINPWVRSKAQTEIPYAQLNGLTMNSVKALRAEPKMSDKAMLNVLSHPAGAVHMKMVVLGKKLDNAGNTTDATAFTGGLDLSQWRWGDVGHRPNPDWEAQIGLAPKWHDVQAMVNGKAVQPLYDVFRSMWNENLKREPTKFRFEGDILPSYVAKTPEVPERKMLLPPPQNTPSQHWVQSLRTIPAFNFKWNNCLPEGKAASWAPAGLFELRAAWKKAISNAQRYIYIEGNDLISREILEWVNEAVVNNFDLKVILLTGGGVDPADAAIASKTTKMLLHESINEGLLGRLWNDPPQMERLNRQIRVFQAWGETVESVPAIPLASVSAISAKESRIVTGWEWKREYAERISGLTGMKIEPDKGLIANALKGTQVRIQQQSFLVLGNPAVKFGDPIILSIRHGDNADQPKAGDVAVLWITYGIYVHAKVTIIDDTWAMIGSNNVWRRCLYTDWEHAVSFIDEGGEAVKSFRQKLWAEHFKAGTSHNPATLDDFADLQAALGAWSPSWVTPGVPSPELPVRDANDLLGPPYLNRITLPVPEEKMSEKVALGVDETFDVDSRDPWGHMCSKPATI